MTMTHYPSPPRRGRIRAAARAIWGVTCLLLGAVDALISAVIGIRPLAATWHVMAQAIADRWRTSYNNAIDG